MGDLEHQLAELWDLTASGNASITRACMLNLVVACDDGQAEIEDATRMVAGVSITAPCRALVVGTAAAADGASDLDVFVSAHCHPVAGGRQVYSEQITFRARGDGLDLVPGSLPSLLIGDLPVVVWWRRPGLSRDPFLAGLLELSDCVVINSERFADPASLFAELHTLVTGGSWHGRAADLVWARLEPWREALASLFDMAGRRPWLDRLTSIRVAAGASPAGRGPSGSALYLAGWLASRLEWRPDGNGWRRGDGEPVRIAFDDVSDLPQGQIASATLEAERDGVRATFAAERVSGKSDFVVLSVDAGDGCPPPQKIKLPDRGPTALLCGLLQYAEHDPSFAPALRCAAQTRE